MRVIGSVSAERTRPSEQRRHATPARPHSAAPARHVDPRFTLDHIAIPAPAPRIQAKLMVNAPDDAFEREADQLADTALRLPEPAVQRTASGPGVAEAPPIVHDVLRTSGRPLDAAARAFLEPRLGHDFGHVRVHADAQAAESAEAVGALAYTVADHVVFGADQYRPATMEGRRLLAHELVHVRQQEYAGSSGADAPSLRRKLKILRPAEKIPNPGGKGVVKTNREQVSEYLEMLCDSPFAAITVAPGGDVTSSLCEDSALIPAVIDGTIHGCMCLCDVINDSHAITIAVDDTTGPHTSMGEGAVKPGVGSDADIVVWSENAPKVIGTPTVSGRLTDVPQWLALGHEMCGHAWLGMQGKEDPGPEWTGLPGHVPATERENLIRGEHGIEARAIWRQPFCGEGFEYKKSEGTPKTPDEIASRFPEWLTNCKRWRNSLNWFNCTDYKLSDTIPEKIPNLCPRDRMRA